MKMAALFFEPGMMYTSVVMATELLEAGADVLVWKGPEGGTVSRELGIPLLKGMDSVHVTEASLTMKALPYSTDVQFRAVNAPGGGVFVGVDRPMRIRKVELQYDAQAATPPAGETGRVVVRTATPNGSGFDAGPPVYSVPAFQLESPMYAPLLSGMSVVDMASGGKLLKLPSLAAAAWLVQLAKNKPDKNTPDKIEVMNVTPTVKSVIVDALPEALSVVLEGKDGPVELWANPGTLLPEQSGHDVSFAALAEKELNAALAAAGSGDALTLRLSFKTSGAARLEVYGQTLDAEYRVQPFGSAPAQTATLGGAVASLVMNAPPLLRPKGLDAGVSLKWLGRVLNPASPDDLAAPPSGGFVVNAGRMVACPMPFAKPEGAGEGEVFPLAAVRVWVTAWQDSEVVLELRRDVAGGPGELLVKPEAREIASGTSGWFEFLLSEALPVKVNSAPIWLGLRCTRGEVTWASGGGGARPVRSSADRGKTFGTPDEPFGSGTGLLAQLFHGEPEPLSPILVTLGGKNALAGVAQKAPGEFGASLNQALFLDALAKATGAGPKVSTTFRLFSRQVMTMTLKDAALRYDPTAKPGSAG